MANGPMLFLTNRRLKEGEGPVFTPGQGPPTVRPVSFDLDDTEPSRSVHYCERLGASNYQEIYSPVLLQRLKDSAAKQILLYIHGFNNLPEPDIFPRAKELQKLCDEQEPGVIEVVTMIWPCDNDLGIVKDYWDDQKAADASAVGFARMLGKFLAWRDAATTTGHPADLCLKRINVLAHSMGNRVLRGTLESWGRDYGAIQGVFRNIFLVAADVVNETLEPDQSGRYIADAARNVTVYYASDDFALRSSKVSNLKNKIVSKRLGHSGPEDMSRVPGNVHAIDCDDFNNQLDAPMGHAYFLSDPTTTAAGPVFRHLYRSLRTGRVDSNSTTHTRILERDYTP